MRAFSSAMTPEEFVLRLIEHRALWRRSAGGRGRRAAGRRVHDLTRRRVAWFKRLRGLPSLPSAVRPMDVAAHWSTPRDPARVKIVLVPPAAAQAQDGERAARRMLRRKLHRLADDPQPTRVELLGSDPRPGRRLPELGSIRRGRVKLVRAVFLEELGAAIVPDLSDRQVRTLEEAGAIVLNNNIIAIDDPEDDAAPVDSVDALHLWHHDAIDLQAARARKLTGAGTVIGILDTGIDADHPEFAGKPIYYREFLPDGSLGRGQPRDFGTHGTHVAAICAGKTIGVAPDADLAVAAVLTEKDEHGRQWGFQSQVLRGLNWLARGREKLPGPVDILNASLGGKNEGNYYKLVTKHRDKGILVVAAVGNNGAKGVGHHGAPAMYDSVIAVGATDANDDVAPFSAWGNGCRQWTFLPTYKPDILAPGVRIFSAVPGNKYNWMDGTSMSCPMVSGCAALMIQKNESLRGDPVALTEQLLRLVKSASVSSAKERCGKGVLFLRSI